MSRAQIDVNLSLIRPNSNMIQFKFKVVSDDISYTASLDI